MVEPKNQSKQPRIESPRIYVASLADYREGRLHGRWINANQPPSDIRREISEMLGESAHGSGGWAIHNYEHFGRVRVPERADLDDLSEAAVLIGEYGAVATAMLHHLGGISHARDALRRIEEGQLGRFGRGAAYIEAMMRELAPSLVVPRARTRPLPHPLRGRRQPSRKPNRRHATNGSRLRPHW